VIVPEDKAETVERKIGIYFQFGARELWHIYRRTPRVVIHRPEGARIEYETVTTPLLPGFTLHIAEILAA
jgi:Uma2 family endonuclease